MSLRALLPPGRERGLAAGEALFRAGDPATGLVLVLSGQMELRRLAAEGRVTILQRAGAGEFFAEPSVFEAAHHCDGVATRAARLRVVPPAALRDAPAALAWALAAHLARRLVEERARTERALAPHAAGRILGALHALPPGPDGLRRLPCTWKSLAAELGLSPEATYRALARLERTGRLRREDGGALRLPGA